MPLSKMMQTTIMTSMLLTLMLMKMTKTTKMLCLLLTLYSILVALIISTILKLTLIPFIVILTMAGGLMILFLYFTASISEDTPSNNSKFMFMIPFCAMMVILMMESPMMVNTKSPLTSLKDPTSMIFSLLHPMTIMAMMMLGIMLAVVINICSKSHTPIRKKKWI